MTRPCSFIRTRLAVFLFSVAIITSPTIFAANDGDSTISIHNPLYGQLDNGIRSFDHGKSWDQEIIRLPSPFLSDGTDGPMVVLKDGTVLHTIYVQIASLNRYVYGYFNELHLELAQRSTQN